MSKSNRQHKFRVGDFLHNGSETVYYEIVEILDASHLLLKDPLGDIFVMSTENILPESQRVENEKRKENI